MLEGPLNQLRQALNSSYFTMSSQFQHLSSHGLSPEVTQRRETP